MLRQHGHRQAEFEATRNAERAAALERRCLRAGDIWPCADSPRNV